MRLQDIRLSWVHWHEAPPATRPTLPLGLISNNMADTWLHVVIALVALALGFGVQDSNA